MIQNIDAPTIIKAAGNKPKKIEEFIGIVNSRNAEVSIARMTSPEGWLEPVQCPEFRDYTVVVKGTLRVTTKTEKTDINAGQAVIVPAHECVQYSTPFPGDAEYFAVCLPAFSAETVHRDID